MQLLLLTDRAGGQRELLPALGFLDHDVSTAALDAAVPGGADLVVVDATADVGGAATACRHLAGARDAPPVVVVAAEGAMAALKTSWGFDDWVLPTAGPAELETRLRLVRDRAAWERRARSADVGDLSIDEETYVVRLRGQPLDLTYREFALLSHLASHPARVFTREQLLQEVWGYDYFGGTRTVDVHIRRLRAKLGAEHEQLIGTVRGVGYKLDPQGVAQAGRPDAAGSSGEDDPAHRRRADEADPAHRRRAEETDPAHRRRADEDDPTHRRGGGAPEGRRRGEGRARR